MIGGMNAFGFARPLWCAFSDDDRFHVLADRSSTLCGIGWVSPTNYAATKATWTQCAVCAHHVRDNGDEVWEMEPDHAAEKNA